MEQCKVTERSRENERTKEKRKDLETKGRQVARRKLGGVGGGGVK